MFVKMVVEPGKCCQALGTCGISSAVRGRSEWDRDSDEFGGIAFPCAH